MGFKDDVDDQVGPKRDRWGRPLLVPMEAALQGQADVNGRTWYSRASSLSEYGSGVKRGLEIWQRRHMAVGLARREDIAAMIAALPPMETDDEKNDKVTRAQVDEYLEMAHDAAGGNWKANYGTAIHGFTEKGVDPAFTPERMKGDIAAYHAELERLGITPVMDEIFTACDSLRVAGTFDHLYRLPDGRIVVGDKKTGIKHLIDAGIQMTGYANADVYDWRTDQREPMALVAGSFGDFDSSIGLHVHIPRGEARCVIEVLDLNYAYDLALHCAEIRDAGHAARKHLILAGDSHMLFLERIWATDNRGELTEIMAGVTDEEHVAAARQHWGDLVS